MQVFGDIMIDYSYVECSSSAVQADKGLKDSVWSPESCHFSPPAHQALAYFSEQFPNHRAGEIRRSIARGARFIEEMQLVKMQIPTEFCRFGSACTEGRGRSVELGIRVGKLYKSSMLPVVAQGNVMMAAGLDAGATASHTAVGLASKARCSRWRT